MHFNPVYKDDMRKYTWRKWRYKRTWKLRFQFSSEEKTLKFLKPGYPAFVRMHLEFASAVWNLVSKSELNKIVGVQQTNLKP